MSGFWKRGREGWGGWGGALSVVTRLTHVGRSEFSREFRVCREECSVVRSLRTDGKTMRLKA